MMSFLVGLLWALLKLLGFVVVRLVMFLAWLFWPVWIVAMALGWFFMATKSAHAESSWLGWLWGSSDQAKIQSLEAANRALHSAAQVANEAAKHQADQNVHVLEAIQALSSERTELANHLGQLSAMALRDSQWAAALNVAGPVLIVIGVLMVIGLALWLTHKSEVSDSDVLDMLLISELSHGPNEGAPEGNLTGSPGSTGVAHRLPHHGPEPDCDQDSDIYDQPPKPEQEV